MMKIVITGSKGLIGQYALNYARQQAEIEAWGVDHIGFGERQQKYISADLCDFGQTVEAIAGADAVIHLAAIRNYGMLPDARLFASNTLSTYNVLEAAYKLGIKRIVLASSIQVNRAGAMRAFTRYQYLPLDEAHPVDPQNVYGLSKQVGEAAADMYARHYGLTVISLRFTWVMSPEEIAQKLPWPEAEDHVYALYAYCDVRDAARACFLAATQPLPEGQHHVAFVTAQDTFVNTPSAVVAQRYFPEAKTCGLRQYESLVSTVTAQRLFGYIAEHSCRGLVVQT